MLSQINLKRGTTITFIILLSWLFVPFQKTYAQSGNDKAGQWKSVGGELLLSNKHNFTQSWTSSNDSRAKGLYWSGGFYDREEDRNYQPWDDVVKNSVSPLKGQITVQGPGNVGVYQRGMGGRMHLVNTKTEKGFTAWTNTISRFNDKSDWSGTVKEYNPNGEFWGFVQPDSVVTLDIYAVMTSYNNMVNTGELAYRAPQDVEYEIWFFPREGGKVLGKKSFGIGAGANANITDIKYTNGFGVKGKLPGEWDIVSGTLTNKENGNTLTSSSTVPTGKQLTNNSSKPVTVVVTGASHKYVVQPGTTVVFKDQTNKFAPPKSTISLIAGRLWALFNPPKRKFAIETYNSVAGTTDDFEGEQQIYKPMQEYYAEQYKIAMQKMKQKERSLRNLNETVSFEIEYDEKLQKTTLNVLEGTATFACKNNGMDPVLLDAGNIASFDGNCTPTLNGMVLSGNVAGETNLVQNGSFESPVVGSYQSFFPNQNIDGWQVIKAAVDLTGSYYKSSDGKQSIDLHGTGGFGGIQQTISTIPSKKYKVVFDFAGNPAGGPMVKEMRVSAAGQSRDFRFDCTGKSINNMGWIEQTWEFTAHQSTTTLRFETLSNSGIDRYGPAIDNVRVLDASGSISGPGKNQNLCFADQVVSFLPGSGATPPYITASNSLGAPDNGHVSLGNVGTLVVQFSNDYFTTSGDNTPDVWIYEIGPVPEKIDVSISIDAMSWIPVGTVPGGVSGIDIDAYIGTGVTVGTHYKYVKLVDNQADFWPNTDAGGADIDAVGIIGNSNTGTTNTSISEFFEDFSGGMQNFKVDDPNAQITNGKLHWNTGDSWKTTFNWKIPMEDIVIEFDGYTESNGFSVQWENQQKRGYSATFGGWFNTKSGSHYGEQGQNLELVGGSVYEVKKWHHYKIVRSGDEIEGFCDGKLIFFRTIKQKFNGPGTLWFGSWRSKFAMDNVKVYKIKTDNSLNTNFYEDFSGPLANCIVDDANAKITDAKLFWATGNSGKTTFKWKIPMENVAIEFDGYTENNGFGISWMNEEKLGYSVTFGGWFNTKSGSYFGEQAKNEELADGAVYTVKKWHHYRILRQGNQLSGYCDGKLIFSRTITQKFQGPAKLWFSSWRANFGLDNVKVYQLN